MKKTMRSGIGIFICALTVVAVSVTRELFAGKGPFEGQVESLAIDPNNPQTIYAGTYGGGVFKTIDGGASWLQTSLTNRRVRVVAMDPNNSNVLYAGTRFGGIFKSLDAGGSWSQMNEGLTNLDVRGIGVDPNNSNTVYAGTDAGGVFKSTTGGANWAITTWEDPYTGVPVFSYGSQQSEYGFCRHALWVWRL